MKKIYLALIICLSAFTACNAEKANIKGRVSLDGKAIEGVLVSDGKQIVRTNRFGRYSMTSDKADSMLFITTPSGTVAKSQNGLNPGFWAMLEKPVNKTERHNFQLVSENQDNYRVMFMPDLHLTNDPRREDVRRFREIVAPFIREKANESEGPCYLMNLGDFTHEIYWYEFDFNEEDARDVLVEEELGVKAYAVTGNHDHDAAIVGEDVDFRSAWLYRRVWGPDRFSVNIGNDHWVFIDNIYFINVEGKGKKAPGIKGDRSYEDRFTAEQLEWLAKDLSYVSDSTQVYLCTHCPMFKGHPDSPKTYVPAEQVHYIDSLCGRFTKKVVTFAGHIHKFDFFEMEEYPNLFQYGLPCTSGIMWETPIDKKLYCEDGSEAGMMIMDVNDKSDSEFRYFTYQSGERYYSIYDMNSVGRIYKESEGIQRQRELAPKRANYGALKFRNHIFVNYWAWKPGDTVEIYEEGKALKVTNKRHEDPVKNLCYDIPKLMDPVKHHKARQKDACNHMFEAKAKSAESEIEVVIKNAKGEILFTEKVQRPLAFEF